jgi:hypothetical protein
VIERRPRRTRKSCLLGLVAGVGRVPTGATSERLNPRVRGSRR